MLPSDLNKFKEYLHSTCTFNEEQLAELLLLLDNDKTRSYFLLSISKMGKLSKPVKPTVEVKEYLTTTARFIEKKIVITSYYTDHLHHYLLGNAINKLKKKLGTDSIIFHEEYHSPTTAITDMSRGLKTSH